MQESTGPSKQYQGHRFDDNWSFTAWTSIRLLAPIALFFSWVIYLVIGMAVLLGHVAESNQRMVTMYRLAIDAVDLVRDAQDVVATDPTSLSGKEYLLGAMGELEGRILQNMERVTIGGQYYDDSTRLRYSLESLSDPDVATIMLDDVCYGVPDAYVLECRDSGNSGLSLARISTESQDPLAQSFTKSMGSGAVQAIESVI